MKRFALALMFALGFLAQSMSGQAIQAPGGLNLGNGVVVTSPAPGAVNLPGTTTIGNAPTGFMVTAGPQTTPTASWTFDWTSPATTWASILPGVAVGKAAPATYSGTTTQTLFTYSPTAASAVRLCFFTDVTVAGSGGTIAVTAAYTSDGHAFTYTSAGTGSTQWATANSCVSLYLDASSTITAQLTFASVSGTPTTRYWATLEKMQ